MSVIPSIFEVSFPVLGDYVSPNHLQLVDELTIFFHGSWVSESPERYSSIDKSSLILLTGFCIFPFTLMSFKVPTAASKWFCSKPVAQFFVYSSLGAWPQKYVNDYEESWTLWNNLQQTFIFHAFF